MGYPNVERVLKQQGRSVSWLADQLNLDRTHTWRTIQGQRRATPEFKTATARALGVPEDILFAEVPFPEREAS